MTTEEALEIVDKVLDYRRLNKVQEIVFRQSWSGHSYTEIAKTTGYELGYIKDTGSQLWQLLSLALGEKVTKINLHTVLQRYSQQTQALTDEPVISSPSNRELTTDENITQFNKKPNTPHILETNLPHQDWGEAIDVSIFYGRNNELTQLKHWLVEERCRLVYLLGMGGMGKTALAIKLAEQIQEHFEFVIWRSLRNAPLIESLLADIIQFLSQQQEIELPNDFSSKISLLLKYLRQHRCLLILDNAETILGSSNSQLFSENSRTGHFREAYESYSQLYRTIGETRHQSCLLVTSREKPRELAALEGDTLPIRSFKLSGLEVPQTQEIFQEKGDFSGSKSEWKAVNSHYAGNPLALKMVAAAVRDLFDNSITKFLEVLNQNNLIFDDIRDLLFSQFHQLSDIEKTIMHWLSINREPVTIEELQSDLFLKSLSSSLLEGIASLQRRSLSEKTSNGYTQQPVVMEYITNELVELFTEEINTGNLKLMCTLPLLQATAKDYIRETQKNLILKPVIDSLLLIFKSPSQLATHLLKILEELRGKPPLLSGYAAGNIINILRELQTDLNGWDFSNLTIWQAYLRNINLHNSNFTGSELTNSVFAETLAAVLSVAISPDGKLLAASDTKGEIRIWQITDGKQLLVCKQDATMVWSLSFSPNAQTLASCDDKVVRIWDVETGECIKVFTGHTDWIYSVAFSHQGTTLASGSVDTSIKLWDVSTGECYQTIRGHTSIIFAIAFSPDDKLIASGSQDNTVKIWDVSTSECLHTLEGHTSWIWSVAISPCGKLLASGSHDNTVKLWNITDGKCLNTLQGHKGWIWSVAFSRDGKTLASGSDDQTVRLWDISKGRCRKILSGHAARVWSVVFSPNGTMLASGSEDQTAKLWDIRDGKCGKTFQGYNNLVWSVAFHPEGKMVASASEDGMIRLWNVEDGKYQTLSGHTSRVWSLAFSPDGETIASSSCDRTIKLWNIKTGICQFSVDGHQNWVNEVAFSSNGRIIASAGGDGTVKLWNVPDGKCLKTLSGHESWVMSVAFSPDGQQVASGSGDGALKIWDVQTGECLKTWQESAGFVSALDFHPHDGTIAFGGGDCTVQLRSVWQMKNYQTLLEHASRVWSVAFSPVGKYLATGSEDSSVRLYNLYDGEYKTLLAHTNCVRSVAFNNDGTILATGSHDETIKLWDVQTDECLKSFRPARPYESMNITGIIGLSLAQKATLKALGAVDLEVQNDFAYLVYSQE
ncbi:NB-ARC domain-containing protein [Aerosakkonema funiforme]|uniref:NB-ARC domain-containing protein n=1 Tax=Aerosakkonema funiforme TaxID=1246630 RepID=UPI0035B7BECA